MDTYELYHYGIKGQRWGVRRFQKKSGSLTPAGKKRQKEKWSEDATEASKIRKKSVKEMSNAELKRLNERTRLEQEYSRLNPSKRKKAIAAVTATAATMGTLLNLYNNSDKLIEKGRPIAQKLINPIARKAKDAMAIGLWSDIHSDELYHYGVKGMKWGVRRYQNPDGSLTPKGRKRLEEAQKSWERDVRNNWTDAYNKASDKVNQRLDAFNAKYEKVDVSDPKSKNTQKYVKEYCKMFNDIYVSELKSRFGDSPMSEGKKRITNFTSDPMYKDKPWPEIAPMFMNADDELANW